MGKPHRERDDRDAVGLVRAGRVGRGQAGGERRRGEKALAQADDLAGHQDSVAVGFLGGQLPAETQFVGNEAAVHTLE